MASLTHEVSHESTHIVPGGHSDPTIPTHTTHRQRRRLHLEVIDVNTKRTGSQSPGEDRKRRKVPPPSGFISCSKDGTTSSQYTGGGGRGGYSSNSTYTSIASQSLYAFGYFGGSLGNGGLGGDDPNRRPAGFTPPHSHNIVASPVRAQPSHIAPNEGSPTKEGLLGSASPRQPLQTIASRVDPISLSSVLLQARREMDSARLSYRAPQFDRQDSNSSSVNISVGSVRSEMGQAPSPRQARGYHPLSDVLTYLTRTPHSTVAPQSPPTPTQSHPSQGIASPARQGVGRKAPSPPPSRGDHHGGLSTTHTPAASRLLQYRTFLQQGRPTSPGFSPPQTQVRDAVQSPAGCRSPGRAQQQQPTQSGLGGGSFSLPWEGHQPTTPRKNTTSPSASFRVLAHTNTPHIPATTSQLRATTPTRVGQQLPIDTPRTVVTPVRQQTQQQLPVETPRTVVTPVRQQTQQTPSVLNVSLRGSPSPGQTSHTPPQPQPNRPASLFNLLVPPSSSDLQQQSLSKVGPTQQPPSAAPTLLPQKADKSTTRRHHSAGASTRRRGSDALSNPLTSGVAAQVAERSTAVGAKQVETVGDTVLKSSGLLCSFINSWAPKYHENLGAYRDGGYMTVKIGDTFQNRYEILHKLGWGEFSTVWLAHDGHAPAGQIPFVAIKISKCSPQVVASTRYEINLLQYLNEKNINSQRALVTLLNEFEHKGTYGTHLCMVMPLLGPNLLCIIDQMKARKRQRSEKEIAMMKDMVRATLCGLAELDALNMVHTDLKPENILCSALDTKTIKTIRACVEKRDPSFTMASLMPRPEEPCVRVADFGLSFLLEPNDTTCSFARRIGTRGMRVSKPGVAPNTGVLIQTREYRAPEVLFGTNFTPRTDVWSLGCIVFELITGDFLLDPKRRTKVEKEMDIEHLAMIMQLLGPVPAEISTSHARHIPNYFTESGAFKYADKYRNYKMRSLQKELETYLPPLEAAECASFLHQCLTYDPQGRSSAAELLRSPWLTS